MLDFSEVIKAALDANASDIFIIAGQPLSFKVGKDIVSTGGERMMPNNTKDFLEQAYAVAGRDLTRFITTGDDDFAISMPGLTRLRVSTYKQRGSWAAVIRIISFSIPNATEIGIPDGVMNLADITKGLILITGTGGSGKSTTLSCIIDRINKTRSGHIITLEDPIEFLYRNEKCIVSQREIELDTVDYVTALRASLRQSPDVILLGEMRDYETIKTAMTAVETGHLVLSTLHTLGSGNTIERIIDIFPSNQQQQIRTQLAMLLSAVVSEQLVPSINGGVVPAFEIMLVSDAIRNMIREGKTHQIHAAISSASAAGMVSMDASLLNLYAKKQITKETAITYAMHPELMEKRIKSPI